MATDELQSLLADTCTRLFTDRVTPALIESTEKGKWPDELWQAVEEGGLTLPQIPETIHALLGVEPRLGSGTPFEQTLGYLVENAPSFSLRGGTREVLRGIIARGLGLR